MCTLTYFPKEDGGFILTSNRDESPVRPTLSPRVYRHDGISALYPKDEIAGGTWIAAADNKRVVSLLNGGFTAHERKSEYRKSRGIVVRDILIADVLEPALEGYELIDIEPFTLVIVDWHTSTRIIVLVWDGSERHISYPRATPSIWSASLLYNEEMKAQRRVWFEEFTTKHPDPDAAAILNFHLNAGSANSDYGLIMDRGIVRTRSITQIVVREDLTMSYREIDSTVKTKEQLRFN